MSRELEDDLLKCLDQLRSDAADFYVNGHVDELDVAPESALAFHRHWVAPNKPVVIRGGASHWSAIKKWTNHYLRSKIGDNLVTVTETPDGYADAIKDGLFVIPHEETMTMSRFLDVMEDTRRASGVCYIQKQNSNLTDEFADLLQDVDELEWAREAFGKGPDAVNFWMGDQRAVTSTHKDPYENMYAVVRGFKDVILFPPTDVPWLYYEDYRPALHRKLADGTFVTEEQRDLAAVPWISVDPLKPDFSRFPLFSRATPIKVRVNAGDLLYLPSLWFHHLRQSHGCIAVNFWYDMDYDCKYTYLSFVQKVDSVRRRLGNQTHSQAVSKSPPP